MGCAWTIEVRNAKGNGQRLVMRVEHEIEAIAHEQAIQRAEARWERFGIAAYSCVAKTLKRRSDEKQVPAAVRGGAGSGG